MYPDAICVKLSRLVAKIMTSKRVGEDRRARRLRLVWTLAKRHDVVDTVKAIRECQLGKEQ